MLGAISDVQAFGVVTSALYAKFVVTSMLQARKSFAANTRMAEDKQLICAMGLSSNMDEKTLNKALDDEQRWRRIVANDLESMPLALLVFWGAIQNGVSADLTKTLMVVYAVARLGHTVAYANGAAKSRMACWMSGTVCAFTAAAHIAMNVFA
jgi:glutathione S-transferase